MRSLLRPEAEDILASWTGSEAHVSADNSRFLLFCSLADAGYLVRVRRYTTRCGARYVFRPSALGEQTITRIIDSRVDEINRSEHNMNAQTVVARPATLPPPSADDQAKAILDQVEQYERDASRLLARAADLRLVAAKLRVDVEFE